MSVGGSVAVGDGKGAGVDVAVWQLEIRIIHPMRINFFIVLIKTQSPGALFQTIVFKRRNKLDSQSQRIPLKEYISSTIKPPQVKLMSNKIMMPPSMKRNKCSRTIPTTVSVNIDSVKKPLVDCPFCSL